MQENLMPINCDEKFVAHYFTAKSKENNIPPEAVAKKTQSSEDTVKNVFSGKTTNPGIATIAPMVRVINGSLDEMCFGEQTGNNANSQSVEFYKQQIIMLQEQISAMQEQHEKQSAETRAHYEQHRQDYKDHTEHRLADKREIIEQQKEHINTLKREVRSYKIFSCICLSILVGILILEVANPSLGWLRF